MGRTRVSNYNFDITTDNVFNWGDPVIGVHRTYSSANIVKGVPFSNTQQYRNPKVDAIMEQAASEVDNEKRAKLYKEFQQIVMNDVPIYFMTTTAYTPSTTRQCRQRARVHLGLPRSVYGRLPEEVAALDPGRAGKLCSARRPPGQGLFRTCLSVISRNGAPAHSQHTRRVLMTFLRVVGKRLFWAAVLLVLVLCLNFFLIRLAPGDPAVTIAGEMGGASPELLASIREQYGLNQSLFNQFVAYFGKVLHGDLGYSYFFNLPVMELIQDRLPATLLLVVTAVCAAVLIGVCLGVQAGRRPNSWTSHLVTIVALIGFSAPRVLDRA